MAWDFETEPEFQAKLNWADEFVREEVEPLDQVWGGLEFTPLDRNRRKAIDPLKEEDHSGTVGHPSRSRLSAPVTGSSSRPAQRDSRGGLPGTVVYGCQARTRRRPDHRPLRAPRAESAVPPDPLLEGEVFLLLLGVSGPTPAHDPTMFTTGAQAGMANSRIGHQRVEVLLRYANTRRRSIYIVMVVTNTDDQPRTSGMSMFLVPTDTPGVNIVRNVGLGGEPVGQGSHALIHYEDVRVPGRGPARRRRARPSPSPRPGLGGRRIHHAMRHHRHGPTKRST